MADGESLHLRLELVAPRGPVFEGDVEMVVVPAVTGEIGILPRHAPLVAQLAIGQLRALTGEGKWLTFAVAEGFVKVQFNKVIVLADTAEEASAIDVARAEKGVERALQRLEMHPDGHCARGRHRRSVPGATCIKASSQQAESRPDGLLEAHPRTLMAPDTEEPRLSGARRAPLGRTGDGRRGEELGAQADGRFAARLRAPASCATCPTSRTCTPCARSWSISAPWWSSTGAP